MGSKLAAVSLLVVLFLASSASGWGPVHLQGHRANLQPVHPAALLSLVVSMPLQSMHLYSSQ